MRVALRVPVVVLAFSCGLLAQEPNQQGATFEVVSIKRHIPDAAEPRTGGGRRLRDGTYTSVNTPIAAFVGRASPVPVLPDNIVGLPEWTKTERYDLTAKAPAGLSEEELLRTETQRWQALFADRMNLRAHIEQREQDVYDLVIARSDGRLGPELKASSAGCTPPPRPSPFVATEVSCRVTMDQFASSLSRRVGAVTNKTNLEGTYTISLTYSTRAFASPSIAAPSTDDAPDLFIAVQEQLGLKLVKNRALVPFFVIDHIERPTEN